MDAIPFIQHFEDELIALLGEHYRLRGLVIESHHYAGEVESGDTGPIMTRVGRGPCALVGWRMVVSDDEYVEGQSVDEEHLFDLYICTQNARGREDQQRSLYAALLEAQRFLLRYEPSAPADEDEHGGPAVVPQGGYKHGQAAVIANIPNLAVLHMPLMLRIKRVV